MDVGSAKGWMLKRIVKYNERIPMERSVLQQLPGAISMVEKEGDEDIKKTIPIGVDFHMDQLVKAKSTYCSPAYGTFYDDDKPIY